ncbi:MAG: P-loop NTPase fold protein [Bacteroidota bacterium]|nr:P-loop NTPase fold protein [Bacteroidota bacterium]
MASEQSYIDFKRHLENEKNSRIIFSGPFGIGKTTFLREYFDQEQSYITIKLNPINYSVSSNEDIFQLIKHDILFNILSSKIPLEEIKFTRLETLAMYFPQKMDELFSSILSFAPKTGNMLVDNIEPIYSILKKCTKAFEKPKVKSQKKELIQFLQSFTSKEGNIYEEDIVTLLIQDLILEVSSNERKVVLMIDDLDRLDPEHIFRILNIFSSHYHSFDNKHKFNFDKVILVCDIQNIKSIFKHRYGQEVDFMGYMDKFFSTEIYHFYNITALKNWLTDKTNLVSNNSPILTKSDAIFIFDLINYFVIHGKINFRNILKLEYKDLMKRFDEVYEKAMKKEVFNLHISKIGYILKILFGDHYNLLDRIEDVKDYYERQDKKDIFDNSHKFGEYYRMYIFPAITYKEHSFEARGLNYSPGNGGLVTITIKEEKSINKLDYLVANTDKPYSHGHVFFWRDLHHAIRILDEFNAL